MATCAAMHKTVFLATQVSKAWNSRISTDEVWIDKCYTCRLGITSITYNMSNVANYSVKYC